MSSKQFVLIKRSSETSGRRQAGAALWRRILASLILLALAGLSSQAQIPTMLTDKIYKGTGTINLLKDVSAANLQSYLQQNGNLLLGVDLNENMSGNETRDSIGLAIKNIELVITTTTGTMTFRDFYTSTTARILEAGASTPQEYYTLFGTAGSASINGSTTDFNPQALEDVISLRNISFTGTLLSAQLNVTFLTTASSKVQGNETFFDWSGGPEDFALINATTAQAIQARGAGKSGLSSTVSYTTGAPVVPSTAGGGAGTGGGATAAPGAPCPPVVVLALLGGVIAWRRRNHA